MADITIQLPDPTETHVGLTSVAVLRAPTTRQYLEIGEPQQWIRTTAGDLTVIDNDDAIRRYLEACIKAPFDPITLGSMSLANGMVLREAILTFFGKARAQTLPAPLNSSASISDGSIPAASET